MYCPNRSLLWADGRKHSRGKDYANWGPRWHYPKKYLPCKGGQKFAGVTLAPNNQVGYSGKSLRWFAISARHANPHFIIEYPTGRE